MHPRCFRPVAPLLVLSLLATSAFPHGGNFPVTPVMPGGGHYGGPAPPGPAPASGGSTAKPPPSAGGGGESGTGPSGPKGPATGGGSKGTGTSTGRSASAGADSWEAWWFFNKDAFLNLRSSVAATITTYGADGTGPREPASALPARAVVRDRIVPALASLIDRERANDTTTGALMALGRIGEPADLPAEASAVPRMLRALSDPNQEIAETAALALGILRTEAAVPRLIDLLSAREPGRTLVGSREVAPRTRAFAAFGLGLVARTASDNRTRQLIARALTDVLGDPRATSDVRAAAVLALSLDRLDPEAAESTAAPWISRQSLVRFLLRQVGDATRDPVTRAHAVTALARLGDDLPDAVRSEVVERVLGLLAKEANSENEVTLSALQALGRLAEPGNAALDRRARAALLRALDAPAPLARSFALVSLAEIGGRGVDGASAGALECRSALANEILRGKSTSRPWGALALGLLERIRADRGGSPVESSRQLLREWFVAARGREEVGAGAIALGLCREARAEPLLRARLAEASEDTGQGFVALALGMIGAREAVPSLRQIVEVSRYRPELLEQAAVALALLGDKETTAAITGFLAEAKGLAAQAALANALGLVGDGRCVDPLLALVARKELSASTRGLAAAALGGIAEESLLPWRAPICAGINYRAVTASLFSGDGTGILEIL